MEYSEIHTLKDWRQSDFIGLPFGTLLKVDSSNDWKFRVIQSQPYPIVEQLFSDPGGDVGQWWRHKKEPLPGLEWTDYWDKIEEFDVEELSIEDKIFLEMGYEWESLGVTEIEDDRHSVVDSGS